MMARRTPPLPGATALLLAAALLASSPARGLAFRTCGAGGRSIIGRTRGAAVHPRPLGTATAPRADRRRPDWTVLASTESGVEEMTAEVNGVNGDASGEEVETAELAAETESGEDDEAEDEEKSDEEKLDEAMMAQAIMMANSAGGERGSREF